ncbi:phosphoesterase [Acidocella sp. KAb 2-4]|uniref:phosphoesterase n=1 Tax=Acidocella sp. KAb 2-4 TaxID=2885158 RepID=UPI001D05EFDD|nr:phosphoesterase [Acidocella sp. KAb 2-4]MCB5943233.1 phosphoesterase [Acidocella sp. KAb 2-4]
MTAAPLHFRDERLMLDPSGAGFLPKKRVLILADPQFGAPLPLAHDARAAIEQLNRLLRLYRPAKLILLGRNGAELAAQRLSREDRARLDAMAREAAFIWVSAQNSEPGGALPGTCTAQHREGAFIFRHEPATRLAPREIEISGLLRPRASIDLRGKRLARPCFVADAQRLLLPAFGDPAGGMDVREPAISRLFPRGLRVFLLGQEQLFSFALEQLGRLADVA